MLLTQRITELCLTSANGPLPFAVLVEQDDDCGWAIATGDVHSLQWRAHVLSQKGRNSAESWALDAWGAWLRDIAQGSATARMSALARIEATTPGIIVRRPKTAHTRFPARALAQYWQRRRLHERAETIAANIAARLAGTDGAAHWASAIRIDDHEAMAGDWIVVHQPGSTRELDRPRPGPAESISRGPAPVLPLATATDLAIIQVIDLDSVEHVKSRWAVAKSRLGGKCPYRVAVVRGTNVASISDLGCLVGEHFGAPEYLAVAAARAQWA